MVTATKTTKKATKKANKTSAKKAEVKKVEVKKVQPIDVRSANSTKADVKRDGWGARYATGRHTVNAAVVEAGTDGAALKDITDHAAAIAKKVGCNPRGAVGTYLADLKAAGLCDNDGDKGWRATELGMRVWHGKEARPKIK